MKKKRSGISIVTGSGADLRSWKMSEQGTTYSGSDCAGCKETRESSSSGVILIGNHMFNGYTRKESELYAAALGAFE